MGFDLGTSYVLAHHYPYWTIEECACFVIFKLIPVNVSINFLDLYDHTGTRISYSETSVSDLIPLPAIVWNIYKKRNFAK